MQAEIKHLQDDLKKHKADPDRLKMPINDDNNDGFDHERNVEDSLDAADAGTDDDENDSKPACANIGAPLRCKAAVLQLLQNAIPGWLIINTDWAENWVLSPARMLQSQYWAQVSTSIHVSVGQYLSSKHWYDRHTLNKGSRVMTVDDREWVVVGQCAEEVSVVCPHEVNDKSPTITKFNRSELRTMLKEGDEVTTSTGTYGRVRGQVGTVVQVEIDGDVRQCDRDTLHLRQWVTKAFFGLTNDRKQYAALNKALLALELS